MKKRLLICLLLIALFLVGCDPAGEPSVSGDGLSSASQADSQGSSSEDSPGEDSYSSSVSSAVSQEEGEEPPEQEHKDEDDNGFCDDCGTSVTIVLDIFAINDLHGKVFDTDAQAGVDEMTTYFKNAYATEDHVLLLSSGDMWQGSAESNLTKGALVTDWMNELDFVSMTLGNHEYDWGEDYIEANADLAEFPFLAINVYDRDTDRRAEYCSPSVLVERGGATIGIIGAIGDCHSSISGEFSGDVYFKTGSQLTALVKEESARLRAAGADFIIYSIHDGYAGSADGGRISDGQLYGYYDPVLSEGYVDIVFEGHTHYSYTLQDDEGVYHLQNGGDNRGISYAEAEINFANGTGTVRAARQIRPSEYEGLADDPIVEELADKYREQISQASRVLGTNDMARSGETLCQLVADLYIKAGVEAFGDEYDIVLGGGFMSVRSPGYLAAGQVTFSQLQTLFPFENTLVLCSIKGRDLLSRFINTNNSNYFISFSDYGNGIKGSIDPGGTYYIITDTYSSTYAPNRLTEIKRYTEGVFAQHLLADYIEAGGLTSGGQVTYTSVAEILEIGSDLSANQTTSAYYYVRGTVTSVVNTTWGNLYIVDEAGNQLFIYGVYNESGTVRYDAMQNPPGVGDTVILYGQIMRYVNDRTGEDKVEIKNARLIPVS